MSFVFNNKSVSIEPRSDSTTDIIIPFVTKKLNDTHYKLENFYCDNSRIKNLKIINPENDKEEIIPFIIEGNRYKVTFNTKNKKSIKFTLLFLININNRLVTETYQFYISITSPSASTIIKCKKRNWKVKFSLFLSFITVIYLYILSFLYNHNSTSNISSIIGLIALVFVTLFGIDLIKIIQTISSKRTKLFLSNIDNYINPTIYKLLNFKYVFFIPFISFILILIISINYIPIKLPDLEKFDYWIDNKKINTEYISGNFENVKFSLKNNCIQDTNSVIILGGLEKHYLLFGKQKFKKFNYRKSNFYSSESIRINIENIIDKPNSLIDSCIWKFLFGKTDKIKFDKNDNCFYKIESDYNLLDKLSPCNKIVCFTDRFFMENIASFDTLWRYLLPTDSANYLNFSNYNNAYYSTINRLLNNYLAFFKEFINEHSEINNLTASEMENICYLKINETEAYTGVIPFYSGTRVTFDKLLNYYFLINASKIIVNTYNYDLAKFGNVFDHYTSYDFGGRDSRTLNLLAQIISFLQSDNFKKNNVISFSQNVENLIHKNFYTNKKQAYSNKMLFLWYLFTEMYRNDCEIDSTYYNLFKSNIKNVKKLPEFQGFISIKPIDKKFNSQYIKIINYSEK